MEDNYQWNLHVLTWGFCPEIVYHDRNYIQSAGHIQSKFHKSVVFVD